MNWNTIESGWNNYKANAKQQWSKLSDEQVSGTQGKRDQLCSRVQEAYSVSKEDAERQVSDWQSKQTETGKQGEKQEQKQEQKPSANS